MKPVCDYLDYSGRDDVLAGGVRMVPVQTPIDAFRPRSVDSVRLIC